MQHSENNNQEHVANESAKQDQGKDKAKDFFERGEKGNDSQNMGNDITGDVKIANSEGEMEGGDDKTWHINEGK